VFAGSETISSYLDGIPTPAPYPSTISFILAKQLSSSRIAFHPQKTTTTNCKLEARLL